MLILTLAGPDDNAWVRVSLNGQELAILDLANQSVRRYTLLWGGNVPASGIVTLELAGDSQQQTADQRSLTALVESVEIRSLSGISAPPLLPLLFLGSSAALLYALVRLLGGQSWLALLLASLAGGSLALAWGLARLWVAPFLGSMMLGLGVVVGLLTSLYWSVRRTEQLEPLQILGLFAASSALIPFYIYARFGWEGWFHWGNFPILLLPLGLAILGLRGELQTLSVALALLVCAGLAAGGLFGVFSSDYATDFHAIYRRIAAMVHDGAPLYDLAAIESNPLGDTYKYPPAFALLFAPFAQLPFVPAIVTWRAFNFLLLIIAVWLLLRSYNVSLRSWMGAGLFLLLCTLQPLIDTLRYGQVDLLMLALIMAGLYALRRNQNVFLGIWIGIAAAFKLYPAYLLGLALVQRRWRAFVGAALAAGLISGLALVVFGWTNTLVFLRDVLAATGVGTAWVENQTFNGFLNRLLSSEQIALLPDDGGVVRLATYAWAIVITGLTAWLTRPASAVRPDMSYGLWVVAMLLILPVAWMHYQTLLLIPFFQIFVLARDQAPGLRWPALACYMLAWLLLSRGNMWTFFDRTLYGPFWQLILSYKFYGLLLLYGAIVLASFRTERVSSPATNTTFRYGRYVAVDT